MTVKDAIFSKWRLNTQADGWQHSSSTPPTIGRKWNPGHWVALATPGQSLPAAAIAPETQGVQRRYLWKDIEPTQDNYVFTQIQADLQDAQNKGIQLIVFITDKTFDGTRPNPPYLDSSFFFYSAKADGYCGARWQPTYIARMKALLSAIGAAFDTHPNFAGVALQETALGLNVTNPSGANYVPGYTPELYRDAWISIGQHAGLVMPRSYCYMYINFLTGHQSYINNIIQACIDKGVVFCGPDILADSASLNKQVYPSFETFKGQIHLANSMQNDSYRATIGGGTGAPPYWTMRDTFIWARDNLHLEMILWNYVATASPAGSNDYDDAKDVFTEFPTWAQVL